MELMMMTTILMMRATRRDMLVVILMKMMVIIMMTMLMLIMKIYVWQGSCNIDDDDGDYEAKPEDICFAGQLASLLYSSTKTASSSLMLEQDKPKTLLGILQPTIHKRREILLVSCIFILFSRNPWRF